MSDTATQENTTRPALPSPDQILAAIKEDVIESLGRNARNQMFIRGR